MPRVRAAFTRSAWSSGRRPGRGVLPRTPAPRSVGRRDKLAEAGPEHARRAEQDWDEHSKILAAVIDGDEDLASMLATRHVHRAAEAAFGAANT